MASFLETSFFLVPSFLFLFFSMSHFLRRGNIFFLISALVSCFGIFVTTVVAAPKSQFTQVINPGTLSTDVIDENLESVENPSIAFDPLPFSFACQTSAGTLGTTEEQIYVQNPSGANNGWTLTLSSDNPGKTWSGTDSDGESVSYDFNDPTESGCGDGSDADSVGGQLSIDPSRGTIETGICKNCTTDHISLGTPASFEEGSTDVITLLSGSAASDDMGDWILKGIHLEQTIPPEQEASDNYAIELVLSLQAT